MTAQEVSTIASSIDVPVYVLVVGTAVSAGSWAAWQWLERHPDWAATGHSHGETAATDDHHGASPKAGAIAQVVSRSITVNMDDQMRFTPSQIDVNAGETIRFVVTNSGRTAHEMVLGSDDDIRACGQTIVYAVHDSVGHLGIFVSGKVATKVFGSSRFSNSATIAPATAAERAAVPDLAAILAWIDSLSANGLDGHDVGA